MKGQTTQPETLWLDLNMGPVKGSHSYFPGLVFSDRNPMVGAKQSPSSWHFCWETARRKHFAGWHWTKRPADTEFEVLIYFGKKDVQFTWPPPVEGSGFKIKLRGTLFAATRREPITADVLCSRKSEIPRSKSCASAAVDQGAFDPRARWSPWENLSFTLSAWRSLTRSAFDKKDGLRIICNALIGCAFVTTTNDPSITSPTMQVGLT